MSVKLSLKYKIQKNEVGGKLISDRRYRTVAFAVFSLIFNLLYALYNGVLGIVSGSVWFVFSCFYYLILCGMRFSAVVNEKKDKVKKEYAVMRLCGALIIVMSLVLSAINYISMAQNVTLRYDEITMITIATYTFTKLIFAIVRAVKSKRDLSPIMSVIRNIGYCEVAVSVLTMQRSMLKSFGEVEKSSEIILNSFTGAAAFVFILILGIIMMKRGLSNGKIKNGRCL